MISKEEDLRGKMWAGIMGAVLVFIIILSHLYTLKEAVETPGPLESWVKWFYAALILSYSGLMLWFWRGFQRNLRALRSLRAS